MDRLDRLALDPINPGLVLHLLLGRPGMRFFGVNGDKTQRMCKGRRDMLASPPPDIYAQYVPDSQRRAIERTMAMVEVRQAQLQQLQSTRVN